MSEYRIRVIGEGEFNEREWLRREMLWSSIILPYSDLMKSWINGIEYDYYSSNPSRIEVYSGYKDSIESQSQAFFMRGKTIATVLSSASLFRTAIIEKPREDGEEITDYVLGVQANHVDRALRPSEVPQIDDLETYKECERQVLLASVIKPEIHLARSRRLLRASRLMIALAQSEVSAWREIAAQNEGKSLPTLTIPNGGHPRSAGPRVEKLQPIFHQIVSSDRYRAL